MTDYTYSRVAALNFNTTPVTVGRSATGSVYAITDTTFTTPLSVTMVVGGAVTTTVSSDANGFIPDFVVANRPSVVFKQAGSSFTSVLTTTDPVPGPTGANGAAGATGAQGPRGDLASWQTATFYPLNQVISSPTGVLMKVTTAHTSGASYDASKFAEAVADRLQDAALAATFVPVLRPSKFNAVGDGVADDATPFTNMYAATGEQVLLEAGKTYKIGSSITISKATDLNGATLNVTGRVTLTGRGAEIRNGTIIVTDKIYGLNLTKARVLDLTVTNGASGNGIAFEGSSNVLVSGCTVTGGTRGIILTACDKFNVSHNKVSGLTTTGAYGILIYGKDNEYHGGGTVTDNDVTDCYFGIALFGGEADSLQPGFLAQRNLKDIEVTDNRVTVTTPDTLVGCIYATRATGLNISRNVVTGGSDVGVDFEYCTNSVADGNIITDIWNGGLAAIFGSSYIKFTGNKVIYSRTKAARSASGSTWTNTGPLMVLLRDNPQHVEMKGNDFVVTNGTLGKLELGNKNGFLEVLGNTHHNCYIAGTAAVAGDVTDTRIAENAFTFDINTGNPVIYAERVLRWHCERNTIVLKSGETLANQLGKYITVYDASGTTSDYVHIVGNTVDDKIGQGIGVLSASLTMKAWVAGNVTDRITALWNGGVASSNLTYERNYRLTTLVAPTGLTLGAATAGGTFAAGTYYWKVTATGPVGETAGSNEVTATLTLNQQQPLSWTLPVGATGIKVYRGTVAGAEDTLVATLGAVTSYTDTGAAGTAQAIPTTNTAAPGYTKLTAHDNAGLNPTVPTLT